MIMLRNQKGIVLITVYLVVFVLLALSGTFFSRAIHEKRLVQREGDSLKAFYNAERAVAYACYEAKNAGWRWFTHDWNPPQTALLSENLVAADAQRTQGASPDCYFIVGGADNGCYAANDGSFILQAFPDLNVSGTTVVRARGISNQIERVIEYRVQRKSIYDYYMWSPYDLSFGAWGGVQINCGGGGIHTNENITFWDAWHTGAPSFNAVGELSTGENKTIRYTYDQYGRSSWLDSKDGTADDGFAPLPALTAPHIWTAADPYPYGADWTTWQRWPTSTAPDRWPPTDWKNIDDHFSGSPTEGSVLNARVTPVEKDANGNVIFESGSPKTLDTVEIPGHLDQPWDWDKYSYNPPGTEQTVVFVDGTGTPAAADYWTDLAAAYGDLIDTDILDGIYGNEGETVAITNTNSNQQDAKWDEFIIDEELEGIVKANDDGFELEEPDFADTYKNMAEKKGCYFSLDMTDTDCQTWDADNSDAAARDACLSASIDMWVTDLNQTKAVAQKVSFIDTLTGKWNTMLEIDLKEMNIAKNYPENGIIYSEIPIRLTEAKKLPGTGNPKKDTFNIICEENVYLKGEFNNPDGAVQWMPAAVISKKRIYTLSADFNDPQVLPALRYYLNYPNLYVADVGGTYMEVDESTIGGFWVTQEHLDSDGAADEINYYAGISDANQLVLRQLVGQKQAQYSGLFDNPDPSGAATDTFTWTCAGDGSVETYTWGMMPNTVGANTTYNCLMAAYRLNPTNPGNHLERWGTRTMSGAYFRLVSAADGGGFCAANGDYVNFEGDLALDRRGRPSSLWFGHDFFIGNVNTSLVYDSDFLTASDSAKPIFFGGGPPPTWRELNP